MAVLRKPRRMTLQAQLVTSIVTLFTLVTLAIGGLIIVRLHEDQVNQIDRQLTATRAALLRTGQNDTGAGSGGTGGGPGSDSQAGGGDWLRVDLYTNGTVVTRQSMRTGETSQSATVNRSGQSITLSTSQIAELKAAGLGASPKEVDLGGDIGTYRLISVQHLDVFRDPVTGLNSTDQEITIIGLPKSTVDHTVRNTAINVALLSLAGLIVVGLATAFVVRRATTPLRRVAATASRVSQMPLSSGEVQMTERVPAQDTDRHTEVGQVGAAFNDLLDHVNNALNARHRSEMQVRQFVADASHELRTPLASIKGYAELSRREEEPVPETVTHALGRIESEAGRMTTLVEDMLLLARLDSGRPLAHEPVDLTMLLIETVSDLHAAGPDHTWNLDLPDEAVEVVGDEARLRQVIINLLSNARKHTPAGTTVTAGVQRAGDVVHITVRDNGPGIPPALVPRIFERFTRGDEARTRTEGSTGLGLSIVAAVVAAHHGTVEVTSQPGNTCFTITLPAAAGDRS